MLTKKKKEDKEALFVEHYLKNGFNASQAYIDAGYRCTPKTARVKGCELLAKGNIRKEINARIDNLLKEEKELTSKWIQEVKRLAFSDLREAVEWNGETVTLKDSKELDPSIAMAISEVSQNTQGVKIKLASKEKALELIGKYLSLLTDKIEVTDKRKDLSGMSDKELQNEIDRLDNEINKINDKK